MALNAPTIFGAPMLQLKVEFKNKKERQWRLQQEQPANFPSFVTYGNGANAFVYNDKFADCEDLKKRLDTPIRDERNKLSVFH